MTTQFYHKIDKPYGSNGDSETNQSHDVGGHRLHPAGVQLVEGTKALAVARLEISMDVEVGDLAAD